MSKRNKRDQTLEGPQVLTVAKVGDIGRFVLGELSDDLQPELVDQVVKPKCTSRHGGNWYCLTHHCLTHQKRFRNQFEKDVHILSGTHHLVWLCNEHGAEEP